jgi:hypothetical protein
MDGETNKEFTITCGACPAERTFEANAEQLAHGFTDEELRRQGFVVRGGTSYCLDCAEPGADEDASSDEPEIFGHIRATVEGLRFEHA